MHVIDWLVVALPLVAIAGIALYTRRYVRSVADFMAGGRNAGRFMLCTAKSEMGAGGMSYVTGFEMFLVGGFAFTWWQQLQFPVTMLLAISGFVFYRYRQTRALTLQQFFEMRYSRNFRLVAGVMAFIAGLTNFFIMPLMEAKFLIYFLGFPPEISVLGYSMQMYTVVLASHLAITALIPIVGGQITVLVTDCTEGMFSMLAYAIIALVLLIPCFSWSRTAGALLAGKPGESLVNPFDTAKTQDFNLMYVLMAIVYSIYGTMAWQNQHAFNASAISPHESRMGQVMGQWRGFAGTAMKYALIVAGITYLATPAGHAAVQQALSAIPDANTAKRMHLPIALSQTLPVGIKGLFIAICLMGGLSANGMHLHSWSSIFIQDIVMPLRKTPLSVRQHLTLLRLSVVGVAICVFLLGYFFSPTDYMAMWFAVTEAIFVGGAGACIIGGLYWSRGTTAGAWVGMFTGFALCFGGTLLKNWETKLYVPLMTRWLPDLGLGTFAGACYRRWPEFPNGRVVCFWGCLIAAAAYVIVSLLTCRKPHNMDKLLHRGQYAVEGDEPPLPIRKRFSLYNLVGITEQFTRSDRWVALGIFGWGVVWFLVFGVVTGLWLLGLLHWSGKTWANYYIVTGIFLPGLITVPTTIWFTVGCTRDLGTFFRRLKAERVDASDDGTVEQGSEAGQRPGLEGEAAAAQTAGRP